MKSLILSYSRLARASFRVRALVGMLTLATAVLLKDSLDVVWTHFHINRFIADLFVQTAAAPIVGPLIAPMLSFLAPFFGRERSVRPRQSWQPYQFGKWDNDDMWDSWRDRSIAANRHIDPTYSWLPGNIHHDDS
jgi:hypothetical protein